MRRPRLLATTEQNVGGPLTIEPRGRGESLSRRHSYVVDGVLQVQDAVLQRVADVVFRVAGCGHFLVERAFNQLLVLQHKYK